MKTKTVYRCSACGAQSLQWQGQCKTCQEWNTLTKQTIAKKQTARGTTHSASFSSQAARPLSQQTEEDFSPFTSGLPALDRVLGQGLVPGAVILVAGEPGIGKSTLLLQLAGCVARAGHTAVYLSAEESLNQLRSRASRLDTLSEDLLALASTSLDDALACMPDTPDSPKKQKTPALVIIDSVQTLGSEEVDGLPGSVSQVRAVSSALMERAKRTGTTLVLVGHVTKDGQIAGPKLLEHMVDTVLSLEGERNRLFRIMRVMKNRFGPSHELVVFKMLGTGMEVVDDPSTFFLEDRDPALSGAALVMAVDGNKPFVVEVQALVSQSFLAIPRRTALGFDANRLHLLLAVLEKRLGLNLSQVDIYTKIGGGLRTTDPALDAGIVAAVLSSFYDRALPADCVVWGEVDLNGQIRPVSGHEMRATQATRLGYNKTVRTQSCKTVVALQRTLFGAA